MRVRGIFFLIVTMLCTSCGLLPKKEKKPSQEEPARETQTFLGTVSTVNELGKFVLLDFGGFAAPTPGDELEVRRAGLPVATLRAGAEMRRPFAAADILTGTPLAGDDVWSKKPTL